MNDETRCWDGLDLPYVAPEHLKISPTLKLHDDVSDEVDPITHEVLRYALWNINVDHGNTIMKISGSPAAYYGHDFNPVLMDERGGFVYTGPFVQYLSSACRSAIKWTLEHRSDNPGIRPGDVFLTTDPWIGTVHQMDLTTLAPVFVGDELFCWVGSALHTWDLGGTGAGGFNPAATDVFAEAVCIPPVKLVEGGVMRRDIEEMITRSSRLPALVSLDLRATTTGVRTATERVLQLVERYGAGTVKATMRKLQGDAEKAFVKRLATIPDGTWTEQGYLEAAEAGDRNLHLNRVTVTKAGDRLTFTNYGTAPQVGSLNATYPGWAGGITSMLNAQMLFDQMFAIEGALRHIEFRADPGTLTCATRPAAVSGASAVAVLHTAGLAGVAISKMLAASSDAAVRDEVQSCMGLLTGTLNLIVGTDQRQRPFVTMLMDCVGAALSAKSWGDGQDTGGWPWDLQSTMPNVENYELMYPILYLWRKELADSGGAGKFRGGNGGQIAVVPHGTDELQMTTVAATLSVPGPGLFGGYPTSLNGYRLYRGDTARSRFREGGRIPTAEDELDGQPEWIGGKAFSVPVGVNDVWVSSWASASGYGDPLTRDPGLVEHDVKRGNVTPGWASEAYGVVVDDPEQTAALRLEKRTERAGTGLRSSPRAPGPDRVVTESLILKAGTLSCRSCAEPLAPAAGNFKDGALNVVRPLITRSPLGLTEAVHVDAGLVAVDHLCPGCGVLLQSDVAVAGETLPWDIRLEAVDVEAARQIG